MRLTDKEIEAQYYHGDIDEFASATTLKAYREGMKKVRDFYEKLLETQNRNIEIEKAEQQLLGYYHGKTESVTHLIIGMGLKKHEWEIIKRDYSLGYLTEDDFSEIEEYFEEEQK